MGLTKSTILFERDVLRSSGKSYVGLRWCELGCQKYPRYNIPSKLIYKKLGAKHFSFDINGNFGSVKADLTKPLPGKFHNFFDVITDYGTIEHIEDQYRVFSNVHNLCKKGGVMIHILPYIGNWKDHGVYEYDEAFFSGMAKAAGYRILKLGVLDKNEFSEPYNLVAAALLKQNDSAFISQKKFDKLRLHATGQDNMSGDYEKAGVYKILSRVKTNLYTMFWRLKGLPTI